MGAVHSRRKREGGGGREGLGESEVDQLDKKTDVLNCEISGSATTNGVPGESAKR